MGLLFENVSNDDFVPPSGLGKGKGKIVDGVVQSPECISLALLVRGCGGRAGAINLRTRLRSSIGSNTTTTTIVIAKAKTMRKVRVPPQCLRLLFLTPLTRNARRHCPRRASSCGS